MRLMPGRLRRAPRLVRGPRLGTKLMLLGVPLALLVPWVAFLMLDEMERLSVQMQSNQQRLIAESIAISFGGNDELFADLPVDIGVPADDAASGRTHDPTLLARPFEEDARPTLDGSAADWGAAAEQPLQFGALGGDGSFSLNLGTAGSRLFAYLEIADDARVFRDPEVLRLDNADQLRIAYIAPDGEDGRISVTLADAGAVTAYRMDEDWRFAAVGLPERSVRGVARETPDGYAVELAMPFSMLGSRRFFGISFVDVDDPQARAIRAVTDTQESNLVAYRSPDLLNHLQALGFSNMHIVVIDAAGRVRAETGSFRAEERADQGWQTNALGWLPALRKRFEAARAAVSSRLFGDDAQEVGIESVQTRIVATALGGEPIALRRRVGEVETIIAGHPVLSSTGAVLGMVGVEQNIDDILFFQRQATSRIALVSVASLFIVPLCLVAFAGRLAWRIGALRREAVAATDDYGRLRATALDNGTKAGDEVGDLARSVSAMLQRLDQHTTFLKKMPRTLRHEINNPLNTLNTSLEHLAQESADVRDSKYLESAKRGVLRIGAIVQNLADAASLEDSLASEDMEVLDLQALIESYVGNCGAAHPGRQFVFRGAPGPVYVRAADYRIEQLLDKLIDNAVDFHRPNSPITVQLDARRQDARIVVANRGPTLPQQAPSSLFESMVSHRPPENNLHFGLGLHVVRVIAEQHGGRAHAANLEDGSGVAFLVQLPLADAPAPVSEGVDSSAEEPAAASAG